MLNLIIAKMFPKTYFVDPIFGELYKRGSYGCEWCEKLMETEGVMNNCPIHGFVMGTDMKTGGISERKWDGEKWVTTKGVWRD